MMKLDSAQKLKFSNEDKLTDQLSSLFESIDEFNQSVSRDEEVIKTYKADPKILSNEQSMINNVKELN